MFETMFTDFLMLQLDSVLAKTDQMMAMVKDLFGDDAKVWEGLPIPISEKNVTPNGCMFLFKDLANIQRNE